MNQCQRHELAFQTRTSNLLWPKVWMLTEFRQAARLCGTEAVGKGRTFGCKVLIRDGERGRRRQWYVMEDPICSVGRGDLWP